ncbi:hypothetical protein SAY87_026352 [Trapa incisa]|uniref:Uncharacterized protein n=1 Tax=Trapa incisa TaxID=236973 RepID=A0AAN7GUG6_9MYRT|nr:hypothetical protein SAY87_026352 [Trapa incisa]
MVSLIIKEINLCKNINNATRSQHFMGPATSLPLHYFLIRHLLQGWGLTSLPAVKQGPCSVGRTALWFLHNRDMTSLPFNLPAAYRASSANGLHFSAGFVGQKVVPLEKPLQITMELGNSTFQRIISATHNRTSALVLTT